jgi:hypothetical protein
MIKTQGITLVPIGVCIGWLSFAKVLRLLEIGEPEVCPTHPEACYHCWLNKIGK